MRGASAEGELEWMELEQPKGRSNAMQRRARPCPWR
jgi:hypothetical protein